MTSKKQNPFVKNLLGDDEQQYGASERSLGTENEENSNNNIGSLSNLSQHHSSPFGNDNHHRSMRSESRNSASTNNRKRDAQPKTSAQTTFISASVIIKRIRNNIAQADPSIAVSQHQLVVDREKDLLRRQNEKRLSRLRQRAADEEEAAGGGDGNGNNKNDNSKAAKNQGGVKSIQAKKRWHNKKIVKNLTVSKHTGEKIREYGGKIDLNKTIDHVGGRGVIGNIGAAGGASSVSNNNDVSHHHRQHNNSNHHITPNFHASLPNAAVAVLKTGHVIGDGHHHTTTETTADNNQDNNNPVVNNNNGRRNVKTTRKVKEHDPEETRKFFQNLSDLRKKREEQRAKLNKSASNNTNKSVSNLNNNYNNKPDRKMQSILDDLDAAPPGATENPEEFEQKRKQVEERRKRLQAERDSKSSNQSDSMNTRSAGSGQKRTISDTPKNNNTDEKNKDSDDNTKKKLLNTTKGEDVIDFSQSPNNNDNKNNNQQQQLQHQHDHVAMEDAEFANMINSKVNNNLMKHTPFSIVSSNNHQGSGANKNNNNNSNTAAGSAAAVAAGVSNTNNTSHATASMITIHRDFVAAEGETLVEYEEVEEFEEFETESDFEEDEEDEESIPEEEEEEEDDDMLTEANNYFAKVDDIGPVLTTKRYRPKATRTSTTSGGGNSGGVGGIMGANNNSNKNGSNYINIGADGGGGSHKRPNDTTGTTSDQLSTSSYPSEFEDDDELFEKYPFATRVDLLGGGALTPCRSRPSGKYILRERLSRGAYGEAWLVEYLPQRIGIDRQKLEQLQREYKELQDEQELQLAKWRKSQTEVRALLKKERRQKNKGNNNNDTNDTTNEEQQSNSQQSSGNRLNMYSPLSMPTTPASPPSAVGTTTIALLSPTTTQQQDPPSLSPLLAQSSSTVIMTFEQYLREQQRRLLVQQAQLLQRVHYRVVRQNNNNNNSNKKQDDDYTTAPTTTDSLMKQMTSSELEQLEKVRAAISLFARQQQFYDQEVQQKSFEDAVMAGSLATPPPQRYRRRHHRQPSGGFGGGRFSGRSLVDSTKNGDTATDNDNDNNVASPTCTDEVRANFLQNVVRKTVKYGDDAQQQRSSTQTSRESKHQNNNNNNNNNHKESAKNTDDDQHHQYQHHNIIDRTEGEEIEEALQFEQGLATDRVKVLAIPMIALGVCTAAEAAADERKERAAEESRHRQRRLLRKRQKRVDSTETNPTNSSLLNNANNNNNIVSRSPGRKNGSKDKSSNRSRKTSSSRPRYGTSSMNNDDNRQIEIAQQSINNNTAADNNNTTSKSKSDRSKKKNKTRLVKNSSETTSDENKNKQVTSIDPSSSPCPNDRINGENNDDNNCSSSSSSSSSADSVLWQPVPAPGDVSFLSCTRSILTTTAGTQISANRAYVCKIVYREPKSSSLRKAIDEMRVLATCAHPCILAYIESFTQFGRLHLITEYVDCGDLSMEIKKRRTRTRKPFAEQTILSIFVQVCLALEYLHRHNIIHRDLKPANVLLSRVWVAKLCDFGMALQSHFDVDGRISTTCLGTPTYQAPEVSAGRSYGEKCDMWSLGCVLYELLCLRPPWISDDPVELERMMRDTPFPPLNRNDISPHTRELLHLLLVVNPNKRYSAKQILQLPFMQQTVQNFVSKYEKSALKTGQAIDVKYAALLQDHAKLLASEDTGLSSTKARRSSRSREVMRARSKYTSEHYAGTSRTESRSKKFTTSQMEYTTSVGGGGD